MWVRKAISYMMPRTHLAEDIGGGFFRENSQVYVPNLGGGVLGYNPNLPDKPYSPEQAWEMMEKAGYKEEYLTLVPPTPQSQFILYAVAGAVVGAVIGGGSTFVLSRKK